MTEKIAYSVSETADLLGVSTWSVYRLVDAGILRKLPHLGRRVLIARVEIERYAASGISVEGVAS